MADNNTDTATTEESNGLTDVIAQKAEKLKYPILALAAILIAVAAIVNYSRKSAAQADAAARDKVFATLAGVQTGSPPATDAAALFAQEARDFKGMSAGAQASLYEFSYLYNENRDYPAAEEALRRFIADYPESIMIPRARLALAQSMMQQGKVDEAIAAFRAIADSGDAELLPEAKLALAQALERRAEEAKDNPGEYRARLEEAEAEYTDIITRAQVSVPAQRGFWPQAVTLPADYALVQIKDKLAGHVLSKPLGLVAAQEIRDGVMSIPPPPADIVTGTVEAANAAANAEPVAPGALRPPAPAADAPEAATEEAADEAPEEATEAKTE